MEPIESFSEIVEFPVITNSHGKVISSDASLKALSNQQLASIATMLQGKVSFIKIRAIYEPIEGSQFCTVKDCFSLADNDKCEAHDT